MKSVSLPDGSMVALGLLCIGPTEIDKSHVRNITTPEEMAEFLGDSAESYRHYFESVVCVPLPKGPR